MIIQSILPKWPERFQAGCVGIWVDGTWLKGHGPYPCLGKSDNESAAAKGNGKRDPTKPLGDHPTGEYVIEGIFDLPKEKAHSYGPLKIVIQPVSGDCVKREDAEPGDDGILIHGGEPRDGKLRPTHGCLRMFDADLILLAEFARINGIKKYECLEA